MRWILAALIASAAADQPHPPRGDCSATPAEAPVCLRPEEAARASKTFGNDTVSLRQFQLQLLQRGCGQFGTLNRKPGSAFAPKLVASVALETGIVHVVQVQWTTRDDAPLIAWIAARYLSADCRITGATNAP